MNIFEGARRIALLAAGLGIVCACIAIYAMEPSVEIKYRVPFFGLPPVRSAQCAPVDGTHSVNHRTPEGRDFRVTICFPASRADNGKMLIPYTTAPDGRFYMASEYSEEVREYMTLVSEAKFTPTATDISDADKEYFKQTITRRLTGLGWMVVGLAAFWAFVSVVGWIVRGFAGIPNRHDRKNSPVAGG